MTNRRRFLQSAAVPAVAGFPTIVPGSALGLNGAVAPGNRVTLATIGVGWMGGDHVNAFLKVPDTQYVAVCDVDEEHLAAAKDKIDAAYGNKDCATYRAFEELLSRRDIDAVSIAGPRSLARHRGLSARQGRQGLLQRKAAGAQLQRRPRHGRGLETLRPCLADRKLAAIAGALPPRLRVGAQRPHRQSSHASRLGCPAATPISPRPKIRRHSPIRPRR